MLNSGIRVFLAVVENKSFSKAAKSLFLTQPAVSFQIQMLEEYFGARLFDRTNRNVSLTEAGHIFLKYIKEMNTIQEELDQEMSELAGTSKGRLVIGASTTIGEYIVPYLLGLYNKTYPEVQISLGIGNTEDIEEKVRENLLDVALVEGNVTAKDIEVEAFLKDTLVLITSPNHPLAKYKKISVFELSQYPFILREKGSGTRGEMEQALKKVGFPYKELNVILELGSTFSIKKAVETGVGISIISKWAAQEKVKSGTLAVIEFNEHKFERDFKLIYHKKKFRTQAVEEFIQFIRINKDKILENLK